MFSWTKRLDPKASLGGVLRDCIEVEGRHNAMQSLKDKVPSWFERCGVLDRRPHFAIDEDMAVACLRAEPSGEVDHGPDRAVVAAALEADRPERSVSVSNA